MPVLGTDLSGKYYPDMPGIAVHPRGRAFKHTYRIRSDYTNSILPLLNALLRNLRVFLLYFLWITEQPVHARLIRSGGVHALQKEKVVIHKAHGKRPDLSIF